MTAYFTYWRGVTFGSREVLEGLVAEAHRGPSPDLARALDRWDGHHYWNETPGGRWLVLVRESDRPRARYWVNALLLALTFLTTTLGGAALADPAFALAAPFGEAWSSRQIAAAAAAGLPFSGAMLAILCAHESGHYLAARRYRIDVSLPYFIPFPPQINLLGTLGAFIRLRSPIFDRRTLFDVGVAGPIAGLAVTLPVLLAGLAMSRPSVGGPAIDLAHQFLQVSDLTIFLGDSPLLLILRTLVTEGGVLRLHPLAVAGWVGLFVTALNLLPLAQLDGGHIAFALVERRQVWFARAIWLSLIALGWWCWMGWWLWAVLGLAMGRGRLAHPRVVAPQRGLTPARRALAWGMLLTFGLCFAPVPFVIP